MANALSIVCLVTAIYAVIAVTFYYEASPKLFSSFFVSFFSLFQAMSGDNWSEQCRDLMERTGQGPLVAIFYVSYLLLGFACFDQHNVVIEVLMPTI